MSPTNFDDYLAKELRDPGFAERFHKAERELDLALGIAFRRQDAGLSQKQLAERVGTTQQQISRLERPGYRGSLTTLERVADALGLDVEIKLTPRAKKSAGRPARKHAKKSPKATARKTSARPANTRG